MRAGFYTPDPEGTADAGIFFHGARRAREM
jgi:hypothetical protein